MLTRTIGTAGGSGTGTAAVDDHGRGELGPSTPKRRRARHIQPHLGNIGIPEGGHNTVAVKTLPAKLRVLHDMSA